MIRTRSRRNAKEPTGTFSGKAGGDQWFRGLWRPAGLMLAMMMLSACAMLQEEEQAAPAGGQAAAQAQAQAQAGQAQAQPQQPAPAAPAQAEIEDAEEDEVAEINREGEVIQLGRFVEDTPEVEPPANNVVELNYEQEDLRVVFEQLGDALGINMVIDPTIDERVSIRTSPDNPLQYEDIWPLMRLLAQNAGVTIEQAGNVYEFQNNETDADVPAEIVMPQFLDDATSSNVLQVTPLTYISVADAREILEPMLRGEGSIIRLGPGNLIGISGTPDQLNRVNAMLNVIDTDPFSTQGIRLYELVNSQAAPVAEELTNILQLIEGEQSSYQVLGLERINAVLVVAPASRGFEEVSRWINVLDEQSQDQVEQLFFYRVKNLNATNLANTLTNVFQQDEDTVVTQAPSEEALTQEEQDPLLQDAAGPTADDEEEGEEEQAEQGQQEGLQQGAAQQQGQPQNQASISSPVSANITVTIVADEDTNSLLIRATPREYRQLLTTINNLDTIPQQVLINAVVGQVTLTEGNEFGIDWTRVSANAASGPARLSTRFLPGGLITEGGQPAQGSGLVFTRTFTDGAAVVDATLNAIASENQVNLLARPSLMVTNNQEGEIKVGQAVPVDSGSTVTGQGATVANISYRDVGIVLTITPHINDDGFVNLEIFQSLSSIEQDANGVGGNPIFTNQEITTTAVVSNESTIVLGGLIQDDEQRSNNGVPVLRQVPVLGNLFSYTNNSNVRRELFVILRPQIIQDGGPQSATMQDYRERFEYVSDLLRESGL